MHSEGDALKLFVIGAALLLTSIPVAGKAPTPDRILADANQYTVKVRRTSNVGLNEDDGSSARATAFLVDRKRGWLLTNAHVASRSPATLSVSFKGQDYVSARRIFVDRLIDVAVLEIDPANIPASARAAELECEELPPVGTSVAIFGHPGDMSYTATRGIISSKSWIFPSEIIQSDAIVNAGNSGGPLIDLSNGKAIGIAAASYRDTSDEFSTAVSLSEPMPAVCQLLDLLKAGKDARYRQLPVAYATSEDDDRPIVAMVFDAASGLQIGDRIGSVNGEGDIRNSSDVASRLRGAADIVTVSVDRAGTEITLKVATMVMPEVTATRSIDLSGLVISNQWKLDSSELLNDVHPFIDFVRSGSPAETTRACIGCQLMAVNNRTFRDLDALYAYLTSIPSDSDVSIILRSGATAKSFYRQYHLISLPIGTPKWIEASQLVENQ
jgi:S1-C subfamily serine protease